MKGEWDLSEICEESRGDDSAPSQQRDFSETVPASRGEKRPLPTTAPPPDADLAADKRARLAEAVLISEDSLPPTPEKSIQLPVSFERRKSSESGDWEEKSVVVHVKAEQVEDFEVGIQLKELMPRDGGSGSEDGNDGGLAEGEGVNVKEEEEEDDIANVKEEDSANEEDTADVKEEHAGNVEEEHGEFVHGGGIGRVKEEPEEVGSDGGAVNVSVEHGGVDEGEAVNSPEEEQDEDLEEEAADVQQMPRLGFVRATIRGVNHNRGTVCKEEVLSFVPGEGIVVYNQQDQKVGCIEAFLGRYLRPFIRTGTIQISAVADSWDDFKIFVDLWIRCHPQNNDAVLQGLRLEYSIGGGGELFRTETFERTEPSPAQRSLLEDSGTWDGEDFDGYEELDLAVKFALREQGRRT